MNTVAKVHENWWDSPGYVNTLKYEFAFNCWQGSFLQH